MPTLTYVDGFEHQTTSANDFGASDGAGLYDTVANAAQISFVAGRTGGFAIRFTANAIITIIEKIFRGANPVRSIESYYVRFPSSIPSSTVVLKEVLASLGPAATLVFSATSNKFGLRFGGGAVTEVGPVLVADTWYRVDAKVDVSANPRTLDCQVDGGTNVQITDAAAASDLNSNVVGSPVANTFTVDFDDWIWSVTAVDYPIGAHKVLSVVPTGAGTDSNPGNMPITGAATAWEAMDEWPADLTTYVAETAIGAGDYREVTFADTTETTIWGAVALAALFSAGAAANNGTARVVFNDLTTVNIYTGDMSEVALNYRTLLLDIAKIDTQTEFNGLKAQVGFSSDATPDPQWSSLMVQYAVPEAAPLPSASGVGRVHVRGTAGGIKIGIAPAVGRTHIRGTAMAIAIKTATATGRVHVRATAVGAATGAPLSAAGVGRVHLRATAVGAAVGAPLSAGALGRIHVRSTAAGIKIATASAVGRGHVRGIASGIAIKQAAGIGRAHVRGAASALAIQKASGLGRLHVRAVASGGVFSALFGKPVADPLAEWTAVQGDAVLVSSSGDAILTAVAGDAVLKPGEG